MTANKKGACQGALSQQFPHAECTRSHGAPSRVAKARERLKSMLTAMGITDYRADLLCRCADDLAAERVRELTIPTLSALNQTVGDLKRAYEHVVEVPS